MSRLTPVSQKKRKVEEGIRGKTSRPKKRIRKQKNYYSSSDEEAEADTGFAPVNLNDSDDEAQPKAPIQEIKKAKTSKKQPVRPASVSSSDGDSDGSGSEGSGDDEDNGIATGANRRTKSKRNDPEAFSTSMSKILSTKLSQSARKDPVLSRSREAAQASSDLANERLEHRAKAKMRAERKTALEKGRIKDVLGLESGEAGTVAEEEKKLRKIAQRGVIQLFNAFHAAHVRAEQAAKEERKKGTVGMANREEKVNEMSKQGFLELIGGKKKTITAEET